jgi:hypothetical protein
VVVEIGGGVVVDEDPANAIVMEARRRAGWLGEDEEAAPGDGDA